MSGGLLFNWLGLATGVVSQSGFVRRDIAEAAAFDENVARLVGNAIIDARLEPTIAAELKKRLSKRKYAALLAKVADPKRDKTRKGDFGEILAAHLLEQNLGYVVPVKKFRYSKIRSDDQPHGIDVIAVKTDASGNNLVEVCFVESKLRTRKDVRFAIEAHDQLDETWQISNAEYHLFFLTILCVKDPTLMQKFLDYMQGIVECETTYCLALHSEDSIWDDKALTDLSSRPPTLNPLTVLLNRVKGLGACIESCYKKIGLQVSDEDD